VSRSTARNSSGVALIGAKLARRQGRRPALVDVVDRDDDHDV
jgi:hypothetical protein